MERALAFLCLKVEYSNTVFFDHCLNWRGLCVEPSPYLKPLLEVHRNCTVIQNCVHDRFRPNHSYHNPDGSSAFTCDCYTLDDVLTKAGYRDQTIDILSLDIEKQENMVMSVFPLEDYDIRFVVMEVTRGPGWLDMDTRFFENGFAKIAVLGRDSVYAKLSEVQLGMLKGFQRAQFSDRWRSYHFDVLEDEVRNWEKR